MSKNKSKILKNKISNIPLKVKKVVAPAKVKKSNQNLELTFTAIISSILLSVNIFFIINIISNKNNNSPIISIVPKTFPIKIAPTTNPLGSFQTSLDGLFVFQDDYTFYWFDSYKYQDDNYYSGNYTYKYGFDALEEIGYTEEEFNISFGEGYSIDKLYSIYLKPSIFINGGKDLSEKEIKQQEKWWFILAIKNDNTAIAYNKTLDLRYNLKRK